LRLSILRFRANQTYSLDDIQYLTISRWCEKWLREDFGRQPKYIPNGIELIRFRPQKRTFEEKKVRILVEGNSDDYYKNVDEAFKVVERLNSEKYEIWFMSYQGKPKEWYRVDKFLYRVPYDDVPNVYLQCDILLKTTILESFSYPPLEMMATGGYVVAVPNDGNAEYLRDGENCLLYEQGDIGLRTASSRNWSCIESKIRMVYSIMDE